MFTACLLYNGKDIGNVQVCLTCEQAGNWLLGHRMILVLITRLLRRKVAQLPSSVQTCCASALLCK